MRRTSMWIWERKKTERFPAQKGKLDYETLKGNQVLLSTWNIKWLQQQYAFRLNHPSPPLHHATCFDLDLFPCVLLGFCKALLQCANVLRHYTPVHGYAQEMSLQLGRFGSSQSSSSCKRPGTHHWDNSLILILSFISQRLWESIGHRSLNMTIGFVSDYGHTILNMPYLVSS